MHSHFNEKFGLPKSPLRRKEIRTEKVYKNNYKTIVASNYRKIVNRYEKNTRVILLNRIFAKSI